MMPIVYIILGVVLTLLVIAVLMPNYRSYPRRYVPDWVRGPYYAHGGREYRPGVLY